MMFAGDASGHWQAELLLHRVDGVLGHGTVGGPFAAHHADQAALAIDLDFMFANQFLGLAAACPTHQRTHAGKPADDVLHRERPREISV